MKKTLLNVLLVLVLLLGSVGVIWAGGEKEEAEGEKVPTIAFVGFSMTNEFWLTLERAAEAHAKKLGVNFVNLTTTEPSAEGQKVAVDQAVVQKVDAIIVGAADSRGFEDSFNKAEKAGIPIIAVDTGLDYPQVVTLVQTDNEAGAKLAGEYIVKQTGGKGKVLIIGGAAGHQTGDARKNGVEAACKAAGMEVIVEYADWLENKASEIAENQLGANPDIKAIFGAWDPGVMAAVAVVQQAGKLDDIIMVGFDALPIALKAIKAGELEATIKQDPTKMGQVGVERALKVINGESVPKYTPIDAVLIDKNNIDEYLP
jgi:ribose transport system substrate-binding protein